jgi:intergrase/recombinase
MNMAYCRKVFATYLRSNGVEQETIDLLQGRTPKSVFAKHYFIGIMIFLCFRHGVMV